MIDGTTELTVEAIELTSESVVVGLAVWWLELVMDGARCVVLLFLEVGALVGVL